VGVEVSPRGRARAGRDLGDIVKARFFKERSFASCDDLVEQLRAWVERGHHEIAPDRVADERACLRPLRAERLALRHPILVDWRGHVLFEGQRYPMPRGAAGHSGTLYLREDSIRIVAGGYEATYPRAR
jgi:hypothetical protein